MAYQGIHLNDNVYIGGQDPAIDDTIEAVNGIGTATVVGVNDDGTILVVWDDDSDPHEQTEKPLAFRLLT